MSDAHMITSMFRSTLVFASVRDTSVWVFIDHPVGWQQEVKGRALIMPDNADICQLRALGLIPVASTGLVGVATHWNVRYIQRGETQRVHRSS